jgi:hypothetical protein
VALLDLHREFFFIQRLEDYKLTSGEANQPDGGILTDIMTVPYRLFSLRSHWHLSFILAWGIHNLGSFDCMNVRLYHPNLLQGTTIT